MKLSTSNENPPIVSLRNVRKNFFSDSKEIESLGGISLDIAEGEFAIILGPSGCGKSTVIRLVAGLDFPTSGSVMVQGSLVTEPMRQCGMVFQAYTSFPWLSVIDNIRFGLRYTNGKVRRSKKDRFFIVGSL